MVYIDIPDSSARQNLSRQVLLQVCIVAFVLTCSIAHAGTVTLLHKDAVVWGQDQVIHGVVTPALPGAATLYLNGVSQAFMIPAPGDSFSVAIRLGKGSSAIVVRVDSGGVGIYSDTLHLALGYTPVPVCYAYATASGMNVALHASVIENPDTLPLSFRWRQDSRNPTAVTITGADDSAAGFSLPGNAPSGEYYFTLEAWDPTGDTAQARTLVTLDSGAVRPFDIRSDHARWIDSAIIYGVTPSIFVQFGQFSDVTAKIPELAQLGVTALWIQPVYATHGGGQGYDVTDYFNIRGDVGGESALRALVQAAHANGLKVLFDFVPNHTSIYHPYAQNAIQYGSASHYYDFYQRTTDAAPYSANYNTRTDGNMTFVYYFWVDLPNLNYSNPEVQRMIIEAGKYWIERLDIDGYRVDAVWGVNARNPQFMQQWRLALKRIKPEILLLAEDKASVIQPDPSGRPSPFDGRFDAAYDWSREESWVSHWVWQTYYSSNSNPTIFNNTPETQRAQALRNSLTNNGAGYDPNAIVFRFMENNDTYRFLATHDLARTKMAGALLFSLNGIPLIFNGQEIGAATHPYSTFYIFDRSKSISAQDPYGLFPYYARLAQLRKQVGALHSQNFQESTVSPSASVYAYRRWSGTQNVFTLVNMRTLSFPATLSIPWASLGLDTARTYYLTDLFNGEVFSGKPATLAAVNISMLPSTTRMLLLADSVVTITSMDSAPVAELPTSLLLAQNYPNPFNPISKIEFQIAEGGQVTLEVYDLLGREVATLVNETKQPGRYSVAFDGSNLASGVYFYRLQSGSQSMSKKMLLVR